MKEKLTITELDKLVKQHKYIRLNLPDTIGRYNSGNGEGIFAVIAEPEDREKYDKDQLGGQFFAYSCSDSFYYPDIHCGDLILAEFRGVNRPVAVWDNLKGTKEAEANKEETMRRVQEGSEDG